VRAVINADGAVPHRRVLHTLDLLRTAGVVHVAFGAAPEEPER
jgi:biopolymer transport protein TolR